MLSMILVKLRIMSRKGWGFDSPLEHHSQTIERAEVSASALFLSIRPAGDWGKSLGQIDPLPAGFLTAILEP